MDISTQTNTQRLLTSPYHHSANNLAQSCSTPPLETSPLSSPPVTPTSVHLYESCREFFVSRETFASEDSFTSGESSSLDTTPRNSVPISPHSSNEADTPVQQFVNALDSPPPESITYPRTISATSNANSESVDAATCVVCMDQQKDIVLAPCQHSHCCLTCFRRIQLNACPVCRTPVRSVVLLSTGLELPVSLVVQRPPTDRRATSRAYVTSGGSELHETVTYERPRRLVVRRSAPIMSSFMRDEVSSIHSRTTSVSSISVARQAESSVRPVPRSQGEAFRRLRETGTVQRPTTRSSHRSGELDRQHMLPTDSPIPSANRNLAGESGTTAPPLSEWENVVLVGHDRKLIMSLAQKLIAAFPVPPNTSGHSPLRDKATFVVNGKVLRIVIIECLPGDTGPQLALRVQRQSPKLVLMCADFFNVSSFESIVRLDMEVLDYLNLPCSWILIKSLRTKRPRRSNNVEDADVRAAKHFLSSRRRCFLITVDVVQENATMRKLGYYLYRAAYKGSPSAGSGSILSDEHLRSPRRSWSFFFIRIDLPSKPDRVRPRFRSLLSKINFGRWLS